MHFFRILKELKRVEEQAGQLLVIIDVQ